jgi:hypothetical protein
MMSEQKSECMKMQNDLTVELMVYTITRYGHDSQFILAIDCSLATDPY